MPTSIPFVNFVWIYDLNVQNLNSCYSTFSFWRLFSRCSPSAAHTPVPLLENKCSAFRLLHFLCVFFDLPNVASWKLGWIWGAERFPCLVLWPLKNIKEKNNLCNGRARTCSGYKRNSYTLPRAQHMRIKNIMQPVAFTQRFGRYIAAGLKLCTPCHSRKMAGMEQIHPEPFKEGKCLESWICTAFASIADTPLAEMTNPCHQNPCST